MSELTAVSLFAGIEGFGLALERCGVRVTAAVEIDPDCRGVIARHFPQTALFSDVKEVTGDQLRAAGFVPEHGILTGGFPCQDLSIAGRRAGLGGARSGLFWHIVRLAREMRPQWLLLENVPGLLSAVCSCPGDDTCTGNGRAVRCGRWDKRDGKRVWLACVPHIPKGGACPGGCMERHGGAMGTVLGALGNLGYGFAYRVLDSQFFGVAQRRERVFIVGCLGDRAAPVEVLLEPESGEGHSAAGRAAGPGAAGRTSGSAGRRGELAPALTAGWGTNHGSPGHGGKDEAALAVTATTLQGGGHRGHRVDAEGAAGGHLVPFGISSTITARQGKGPDSDMTNGFVLAHTLTSEGADASEDGTGRGTGTSGVPRPVPSSLAVAGDFSSSENMAQTVRSAHGQPGCDTTGLAVRRLTPKECERLQAFPDDWTKWRLTDGVLVEQSDSTRYRQIGNAVTTTVPEWIVRRIVAVSAALSATEAAA